MRPFRVACAAIAALGAAAGCSPPRLPPDVAPPRPSAGPTVYRNGVPAPQVQPEPDGPLARDTRAESMLAYIGSIEGRATRAADGARGPSQRGRDGCLARLRVDLGAVDRQARERRAQLRDAAFEDPAEEDRLFHELARSVAQAEQLANGCPETAGKTEGSRLRLRELEASVPGLTPLLHATAQAQQSDYLVMGQLTSAAGMQADQYSVTRVTRSLARFFGAAPAKAARPPPPPAPGPAPPPPAGPPVAAPSASPFSPSSPGAHDVSMLLRSAQITLAVYEVDKKMDAVQAVATELGGYLALRGDRELTVRVPRERFDEALRRIEAAGDVLHKSVAAEDVTDQYVDLELRLKNALAVRARLEKLLEAASVKDAVEIHKELAKITDEVERLEGKLKLLRDRIAFSTITVSFERTEPQHVRSQALLPFPWMRTMGLGPLLQVTR